MKVLADSSGSEFSALLKEHTNIKNERVRFTNYNSFSRYLGG